MVMSSPESNPHMRIYCVGQLWNVVLLSLLWIIIYSYHLFVRSDFEVQSTTLTLCISYGWRTLLMQYASLVQKKNWSEKVSSWWWLINYLISDILLQKFMAWELGFRRGLLLKWAATDLLLFSVCVAGAEVQQGDPVWQCSHQSCDAFPAAAPGWAPGPPPAACATLAGHTHQVPQVRQQRIIFLSFMSLLFFCLFIFSVQYSLMKKCKCKLLLWPSSPSKEFSGTGNLCH